MSEAEADFLTVDPAWYAAHRGALVGVLAMRNVRNPSDNPAVMARVADVEADLRQRFGGLDRAAIWATPPLPAYAAYYKRFGQRYHVAMQLESVVAKGKPIPRAGALVAAMFAAELRTGILTAGHDLDNVSLPFRLGVGIGGERFRTPNGAEATVKPGDIFTADGAGVLSAVVTGPSDRARIGPATTTALYVCYAPAGVDADAMAAHLDEIAANVRLAAAEADEVGRVIVAATETT